MTDIVERLEEMATRAQTKTSREFYRSVKAEIERLRAEVADLKVSNATLDQSNLELRAREALKQSE